MASENNSIRDNRAHSTDSKGSQQQENVRRPLNSSSADRDNVKPQSRPQSMIKVVETVQINPDYMTISGHLR
ncbi:unnamed protein product, partial [Rotaria magnacalcarata]